MTQDAIMLLQALGQGLAVLLALAATVAVAIAILKYGERRFQAGRLVGTAEQFTAQASLS